MNWRRSWRASALKFVSREALLVSLTLPAHRLAGVHQGSKTLASVCPCESRGQASRSRAQRLIHRHRARLIIRRVQNVKSLMLHVIDFLHASRFPQARSRMWLLYLLHDVFGQTE